MFFCLAALSYKTFLKEHPEIFEEEKVYEDVKNNEINEVIINIIIFNLLFINFKIDIELKQISSDLNNEATSLET